MVLVRIQTFNQHPNAIQNRGKSHEGKEEGTGRGWGRRVCERTYFDWEAWKIVHVDDISAEWQRIKKG